MLSFLRTVAVMPVSFVQRFKKNVVFFCFLDSIQGQAKTFYIPKQKLFFLLLREFDQCLFNTTTKKGTATDIILHVLYIVSKSQCMCDPKQPVGC